AGSRGARRGGWNPAPLRYPRSPEGRRASRLPRHEAPRSARARRVVPPRAGEGAMTSKVRAPVDRLAAGSRMLPREVSRYLCRVLRLQQGDSFVAFDPTTYAEADGVVDEPSHDGARVTIGPLRRAALVAQSALV